MAVTFDVTKIPNYAENFPDVGPKDDPSWNPITSALTMVMLVLGPLTEKNFDEFCMRLDIFQEINGALLSKHGEDGKGEDVYVTREQVRLHLGIRTNHSPVSNSQFGKSIMGALQRRAKRKLEREKEAEGKAKHANLQVR